MSYILENQRKATTLTIPLSNASWTSQRRRSLLAIALMSVKPFSGTNLDVLRFESADCSKKILKTEVEDQL